jgi:Glycosyl hydrolase family 79 C-terminal beta domain
VCDHAAVLRGVGRQIILAALAAILLVPAVAVAQPPTITATIGTTPIGSAMPRGFVGVSFETKALHVYTGRDPRAVNPVLVQLLRGLAPGQPPVIRIGGDSTDETWWPMRGVIPPGGITYALTRGWMRTTRALAQTLGAKLIVGVNLAADRPALAAAEAQAILQGIGRRYIEALEIGNEPDLYGIFAWYRDRRNHVVFARPRSYSLGAFIRDFSRWRAAMPRVPLVGPTFARLNWMGGLGRFLTAEPQVKIATLHRYPLRGCTTDPTDPSYASIPNLLADSSSAGLAEQVAPYANVAHSRGLQFRLDEMNSAACKGRAGVSDTFAAALWVIDTLFNLQAQGVDGINVHSLPGAPYEPFTFKYAHGAWSAFVHPEYYGLMLFADAFPPGAHRLPVNVPDGPVKVWATYDATGRTRVVLINKDPTTEVSVKVALQGSAPAVLQRLTAPSVSSTSGVSFGGLSFGSSTSTGQLPGTPEASTVSPVLGSYSVDLPPASVALLTR